ncbi:MAG TPA: ABC transporter permease [Roseiflexaceae bacterium]|jgi:oligopeptide transport system permease protein|nr:ABC transporter permease [Roseiflexaceae bacterium]
MTGYIIRRVLWFVPVLFCVGLITFTIAHLTPGGPFDTNPDKPLPRATQQALEQKFGLHLPLWRQFVRYLFFDIEKDPKTGQNQIHWGAIGGNLGPTYASRGAQSVQDYLFKGTGDTPSRFGYSARLGLQALVFALILGIPLGVIAALKQNTWVDYIALFISTTFISVPTLISGFFLLVVFAVWLGWFKVLPNWNDPIKPWILPTVTLGMSTLALITRLTRSSVLEVKRQDYVRTARAKGLADMAVNIRHVLRNAILPVVTIMGPLLAGLITGAFFTELIFQVPGMGNVFVTSIGRRDYSMIMGLALFYSFILTLGNLLVDLAYGVVDPRISVK